MWVNSRSVSLPHISRSFLGTGFSRTKLPRMSLVQPSENGNVKERKYSPNSLEGPVSRRDSLWYKTIPKDSVLSFIVRFLLPRGPTLK